MCVRTYFMRRAAVLLPPLSDSEQAVVPLPDKFRRSEVYKTLSNTLKTTMSLPVERDNRPSLQQQSGFRQPTYASSFIKQVGGGGR